MASVCVICRRPLADKQRAHAKTCSARCRKALSRRSRVTPIGVTSESAGALPDRADVLRRLDAASRAGSVRATELLLRELPAEPADTDARAAARRLLAAVPPRLSPMSSPPSCFGISGWIAFS